MNSSRPAPNQTRDRALTKYARSNKHRRAASGKELAAARYARESHVTVTYATLNGVEMRIERSLMWGVITKPVKAVL